MGLAPLMVEKIFEIVRGIAREGVTILLVEQNAQLALEVASRGYVMESGAITLAGERARCSPIRGCARRTSARARHSSIAYRAVPRFPVFLSSGPNEFVARARECISRMRLSPERDAMPRCSLPKKKFSLHSELQAVKKEQAVNK